MSLASHVGLANLRIVIALRKAKRPALMCSFGKDSLVLVDLLTKVGIRDVLYIENIDEIVDQDFILSTCAKYDLRLHTLPKGRGLLFFVKGTAQFFCFPFVAPTIMLPVPMSLTPWNGEGEFMCVDDELSARHGTAVDFDFDVLFFGQKKADLLDGGRACLPWFPLLSSGAQHAYHARMTPASSQWRLGDLACCSPLFEWSQADVWNYIERHHLAVSDKIYDGRVRRLHQNHACYRCHDPALPMKVDCPKLGMPVTNMGAVTGPDGLGQLVRLGLMNADEVEELRHG